MQFLIFKDARYFQLIFQSIFLGYGIFFLHWSAEWRLYSAYFGICILTQILCELVFVKKTNRSAKRCMNGVPSALISAFGLSLLLKTTHLEIAAMAAFVAIASKYMLRFNGKHIFNPSALGIVMAMLCTNDAWINAAQWGSNTVILFGALCMGLIIVTRVQKLDVSLAFLGTFSLLLFVRQILFLGWPIDFFVQSISTGSLLLFSFFMITDPRTTPNHRVARIIWAVVIAAVAFYISTFKFVNGAPIWVLVLSQPLIPILDHVFKGKVFGWKRVVSIQREPPVTFTANAI